MKRVFLIILDSFGIGALPDAGQYGDQGSDTLAAIRKSSFFSASNLAKLGLFHIDGVSPIPGQSGKFSGCIARMGEVSCGKDTVIGHWEIVGIQSPKPFPTYPQGFPADFCEEFSRRTGRGILCNRPYSGTEVLTAYGKRHVETGDLIVYTSADSVCQIAAHEDVIPVEELYRYCGIAREMLGVGRVIARPFQGDESGYERTPRRRDFALEPPGDTILDCLKRAGYDTVSVGKIRDIFAGRSISREFHTRDNAEGLECTAALAEEEFNGLCFVNLVDFDMKYGHRNDVDGYAAAVSRFDVWLGDFLSGLGKEDLLMITADHGCDPSTPSTDHSREYAPLLAWGPSLKPGVNLGTRQSFSDTGKTILEYFDVPNSLPGVSFWKEIQKEKR